MRNQTRPTSSQVTWPRPADALSAWQGTGIAGALITLSFKLRNGGR